jgi:hypothetical protein
MVILALTVLGRRVEVEERVVEPVNITLRGLDVMLEPIDTVPKVLRDVVMVDTRTGPVISGGLAICAVDEIAPNAISAGVKGTVICILLASIECVEIRNVEWMDSKGLWPGKTEIDSAAMERRGSIRAAVLLKISMTLFKGGFGCSPIDIVLLDLLSLTN